MGVALDLATHDVDVMQHVLGRPITQVYALGGRFSHPAHEDMLTCLLTFGIEGPFGLLDVNWLTPEKRRELTIIGEGGMLHASHLTQDVWFMDSATMPTGCNELARVRGDAEGSQLRLALGKREPLRAEIDSFVSCIRDDSPEPVSAEAGTRALAIALAIRRSVSTGEPVDVAEALAAAVAS